ncbi:hydrolase [Prauserella marina]|uniref:Glycerophosphoryl diester phosphodiesterase n=1 Tax=Prauserella marina TaxID=530584 RepID=A0A222VU25_9PSEU|nr:glycerophosphodiester phosphodiesterase family protein [Prauserella marina]ASR37322.1 hydrolase [Prauserella marina]PWV74824.1 glycerophosphoryl diester phosphodiesterase [Prauserella marina]SDD39736.1 glycerophosphoryl diester phosphodiesterase [Prauserella marina]
MRLPTFRRTVFAAVLCVPMMAVAGLPAVAHETQGADVIAHRGSSGVAPENTEAAIGKAIEQGADFVEIDVQRTRDGKLVNFHDCTLERTTDVEQRYPGRPSYRVSDFTWRELRALDAGSWFHDTYAGEPIPSVEQVINQVRGKIGLLAEISPCDHYTGLPDDLAAELRAAPGYLRQALASGGLGVQSFEVEDAKRFHELLPEVSIGVLDAERPTDAELTELSEWADDVNPRYTVTDADLVERIHELGMGVNVWTVDEPGSMREMLELGVDGIITDYPQSLTQR